MDESIHRKTSSSPATEGSTDVGEVSWRTPVGGLKTVCFPNEAPAHSWQNVASMGSSIGEKGILYAAKALAVTAIDVLENKQLVAAATAEWQQRKKDRPYVSLIPEGQKPPKNIRQRTSP